MSKYKPPFEITNRMLDLIAEISEKVGRINGCKILETKPHLRKNNRIKSIHSSLKIEANSLSLSEVRDVIEGHLVLGDKKEIQEVKNAYKAYEEMKSINPYSISDLKRIHGIMTFLTVDESGKFRLGDEGVFSGDTCVFVAPPPRLVPNLMDDLFTWMERDKDEIHPLILSAVFHYEFVFIHPFSDGNGRMARLWHSVLLCKWRSIFEFIPLESQIEKYQDEYYDAIARCHVAGNSNIFIEFILKMINEVLDDVIIQTEKTNGFANEYVQKLLSVMEYGISYSSLELMNELGLKSRNAFRENYMTPAITMGVVRMTLPEKPNSKNQKYLKV